MKIIDELFKRYRLNVNSLVPYGFKRENDSYYYSVKIHNNSFEFRIEVKNNVIDGKLIDLDFNDEYNLINQDITTSFIAELKEECINILVDIRDNCYQKEMFVYNQTNRINNNIKNKYDVIPEFLWEKTPNCCVYRNKRSARWFGIIMNISKNKIVGIDKKEIEVINLNLGEKVIETLDRKGIYKAYHMNKKNWVSIILDDTLDDSEIMDLIDISFNMSCIDGNWLIPANPKYYDVVNMFNNSDVTNWKQYPNILVGDTVFLYVAEPYKEIMFKCEVLETNIPFSYKSDNLTIQHLMKIKLLKKYNEQEFSYAKLNSLGIKAIRGPRTIPNNILKLL